MCYTPYTSRSRPDVSKYLYILDLVGTGTYLGIVRTQERAAASRTPGLEPGDDAIRLQLLKVIPELLFSMRVQAQAPGGSDGTSAGANLDGVPVAH